MRERLLARQFNLEEVKKKSAATPQTGESIVSAASQVESPPRPLQRREESASLKSYFLFELPSLPRSQRRKRAKSRLHPFPKAKFLKDCANSSSQ